jgi:hypothetical protein
MAETGSILSAHVNAHLVTREQLAALPAVIGSSTFKPVPHIELIQSLEAQLAKRDIAIRTYDSGALLGQRAEQFAIGGGGNILFGTIDLVKNGIHGTCASIGLRTANDRTMALQMIAGLRVFVCDNLAFSGDTIMMKRRHTSGLNLMEELTIALDKYEQHYSSLKDEVEKLRTLGMTDNAAKEILYDVFAQGIMPSRFLPAVNEVYFDKFVTSDEPKFAAFKDRSGWSLLNSLTEVAKQMPLTTRIKATQLVGKLFGKKVN